MPRMWTAIWFAERYAASYFGRAPPKRRHYRGEKRIRSESCLDFLDSAHFPFLSCILFLPKRVHAKAMPHQGYGFVEVAFIHSSVIFFPALVFCCGLCLFYVYFLFQSLKCKIPTHLAQTNYSKLHFLRSFWQLRASKTAKCQEFYHFAAVICYWVDHLFRNVNNIAISEPGSFAAYLYAAASIDYIVHFFIVLIVMRLVWQGGLQFGKRNIRYTFRHWKLGSISASMSPWVLTAMESRRQSSPLLCAMVGWTFRQFLTIITNGYSCPTSYFIISNKIALAGEPSTPSSGKGKHTRNILLLISCFSLLI